MFISKMFRDNYDLLQYLLYLHIIRWNFITIREKNLIFTCLSSLNLKMLFYNDWMLSIFFLFYLFFYLAHKSRAMISKWLYCFNFLFEINSWMWPPYVFLMSYIPNACCYSLTFFLTSMMLSSCYVTANWMLISFW